MRLCALLLAVAVSAIAVPASAVTHNVNAGGGGDFTAIGPAVSAAAEGDTILVAPGTYSTENDRNVDPGAKNLVILADDTTRLPVIIDCMGGGYAFKFNDGQDATTILSGFTIQNGMNGQHGGGITIVGTSPTIEDCTFLNCTTAASGGGAYFYESTSSVTNCVFRGNTAGAGGGLKAYRCALTVNGCLFDENTVEGDRADGGGLNLQNGDDVITECTIVENADDQVLLYGSSNNTIISNCIIADGLAGSVSIEAAGSGAVTHCVVFGNASGDSLGCAHAANIFHDPLFCSGGPNDYTLCDDSFAKWNNNLWGEQIGAYEAGCEPCGTPVEDATWGAVKALFR